MLMWHQIHRKYRYILPLSNSQNKKVRLNRSRKFFSLVGKGLPKGVWKFLVEFFYRYTTSQIILYLELLIDFFHFYSFSSFPIIFVAF